MPVCMKKTRAGDSVRIVRFSCNVAMRSCVSWGCVCRACIIVNLEVVLTDAAVERIGDPIQIENDSVTPTHAAIISGAGEATNRRGGGFGDARIPKTAGTQCYTLSMKCRFHNSLLP